MNDSNPSPDQINVAELLAQLVLIFLLKSKGIDISEYQVWMLADNKSAVSDLRKGRSKHPGASTMADYAAKETGYTGSAVC